MKIKVPFIVNGNETHTNMKKSLRETITIGKVDKLV